MKDIPFFCFFDALPTKKAVFDATPFFEVASGLFVTSTISDFLFLFSVLLAFQACVLSSRVISTAAVPVQACSFVFSWLSGGTWGIYTKKRQKTGNSKFQISCVFEANKKEKW